MSVTAAKWLNSWPRLQFRFFLNLFSCLLTTNLSRRNDRSRAGLPTLFNFRRNGNRQWIPITFHVYSRYLAATRDVHSTATGCKWLAFCFTTMMQRNQSAHTACPRCYRCGNDCYNNRRVSTYDTVNLSLRVLDCSYSNKKELKWHRKDKKGFVCLYLLLHVDYPKKLSKLRLWAKEKRFTIQNFTDFKVFRCRDLTLNSAFQI